MLVVIDCRRNDGQGRGECLASGILGEAHGRWNGEVAEGNSKHNYKLND